MGPDFKDANRSWRSEQATRERDTPEAGDRITAWASRHTDDQQERLLLVYARPLTAKEIQVHESCNPGALCKVSVFGADGKEVEVWQGEDPTTPGSGKGVSKIPVNVAFAISRVKLYLDSRKLPGWNEIDAVGLVDQSAGKVHWAASGTASSTYAELSGGGASFSTPRYPPPSRP